MAGANIHYELSDRIEATTCGGIGAMHLLAQRLGLPAAIDRHLHVLKIHLPYHESDHVLNLTYNALCGGTCLEDLELRREDAAYLDGVGASRVPDPTTAGDFCRRFSQAHIDHLHDAFDEVRHRVWQQQEPAFFDEAVVDMDGVLVETAGECKQGIDIAYNGTWGYHPLVVSLANTGEVLRLVNRSGNRPSHEGAAVQADRAIDVCLQGGFHRVLLRGDTDFTQTKHLDRWDETGRVRFLFGVDVRAQLHLLFDHLPENAWQPLDRRPRRTIKTSPRARPENIKRQIVRQREFENIRLIEEHVAETEYRPRACRKPYRLIAVRKELSIEKGQQVLFPDYRYFIYITNDRTLPAAEVVRRARQRCDQENLNAQLKSGVRSLHAPVDSLLSNGAYMVMTTLAWNLKAWWALSLSVQPGRWQGRHREQRRRVLRMEFRTFVNAFMRIPAQVLRSGRRLVWRLLGWNQWQEVFFRMLDALHRPLRC